MGRRPRSKTPFSTGTQRTHSVFRGPPVRTRLRRAHSASRAYGEGHGSKRQRLYPPLHRGKPYRIRWEVSHPQGVFRKGRRKSMQDGESLPCGISRRAADAQRLSRLRRGPRQQMAMIASSAPRGKALQKQMGSLIAHPQGALHKGRRKSMQDGESLPCGMSRHPSFLYINRNLLANATCFFL